jgi:hypothetical protein
MSRLEEIERQIRVLASDELAALRKWFLGFDAAAWDQQFEADVKAGKLESLAVRALRDHAAGQSRKL